MVGLSTALAALVDDDTNGKDGKDNSKEYAAWARDVVLSALSASIAGTAPPQRPPPLSSKWWWWPCAATSEGDHGGVWLDRSALAAMTPPPPPLSPRTPLDTALRIAVAGKQRRSALYDFLRARLPSLQVATQVIDGEHFVVVERL